METAFEREARENKTVLFPMRLDNAVMNSFKTLYDRGQDPERADCNCGLPRSMGYRLSVFTIGPANRIVTSCSAQRQTAESTKRPTNQHFLAHRACHNNRISDRAIRTNATTSRFRSEERR